MWHEFNNILEEYSDYLKYLPESEKRLIDFCKRGLKQKEISKYLGVAQGAISSRLNRIKDRLPTIKKIKDFDLDRMDTELKEDFIPFEIELLKILAQTTCQTETSRILNNLYELSGNTRMNQVKVRYRFKKFLKIFANNEKYKDFFDFFTMVEQNLYKLHEVMLPHFDRN